MSGIKDRIKRLYKVLGLTAVMSIVPTTNASSEGMSVSKDKNPTNKEISMFPMQNSDMIQNNLQEVADYMSTLTMGELREQGYLQYDTFRDYKFTGNDFKQMQCGEMGKSVVRSLFKKYRNNVPKGKCLAAVRAAVCSVSGENILAEPIRGRYWACNWPKGIQKYGDKSPIIYLGDVKVDNNSKDTGEGNICKEDLLYLTGITVMSGGKEPAGHTCFNKPVYDKKGEYLRTDARCDGNESLVNILTRKVGGNGRRYGNTIQAFCMADDKPSPDMAMYLAQTAMLEAYEKDLQLVVEEGKLKQRSLKVWDKIFKDNNCYALLTRDNSK